MARYRAFAAFLCLVGCVDLSEPPELQHRDSSFVPEGEPDADPADDAFDDFDADPGPGDDAGVPADDGGTTDPDAADDAPVGNLPDVAPGSPDVPRDSGVPLLANGGSCRMGVQCQSGLCVDGVCCNTSCNGRCQACDVAGSVGRCTAIKAGDDPDSECDADPIASCGRDGTCDGSGACRKYAVGTQCSPGSCTGSTETAASTCNATGLCQVGATRMCTGGHTCMGASCGSMCASDGECQGGFFCDNNACQPKRTAGAACTAKNQCASDFCVDGVCCNTACAQTCYACDLPGSVGMCNPIPDGQERGATPECAPQAPTTCGHIGGCNGRGACRLFPTGTLCGNQSCTASVQTDAPVCNGLGTCGTSTTHDCGNYLCSGATCATTCTMTNQCKAGFTCVGAACKLVKITKLVVHDTVAANVALWMLQTNFQIGPTMPHAWGEAMWAGSYVKSMDTAGSVFLGKQWISVATESKRYTGGPEATITLAATSDVYLIVDDRWGTTPAWLTGWTKTTIHLQIFESASNTFQFTAWKKTAPAGDVDLPKIGAANAYNYFVIVD
jgi:hypothetical protein